MCAVVSEKYCVKVLVMVVGKTNGIDFQRTFTYLVLKYRWSFEQVLQERMHEYDYQNAGHLQ